MTGDATADVQETGTCFLWTIQILFSDKTLIRFWESWFGPNSKTGNHQLFHREMVFRVQEEGVQEEKRKVIRVKPKETSIFKSWVEEQKQINCFINDRKMNLRVFAMKCQNRTMATEVKINVEIEDRTLPMDFKGAAQEIA